MPHTFVIMMVIILFATLLTWIIPAGQYVRVENADGVKVVDPNQFSFIDRCPVNPLLIPLYIVNSMCKRVDLMLVIIFSGGAFDLISKSGALHSAVARVAKIFQNRLYIFIPIMTTIFALICTTQGVNQFIAFAPVVVMITLAMGLDSIVGAAIILLGGAVGFATEEVDRYVTAFYQDPSWDHMVAPGMVYISHPTEYGTLYTLDELKALSAVCRKHKIPLFLDGARLGCGLAARDTDVTLKDIASLCDIFYIGGTKVGALFGEAVVIPQPGLIRQFDTIVKQRGVLLAKGRLLGLQFDTLFTDGLYLKIARHAIDMADRIVEGLKVNGYTFYIRPQSNQLFVQLENSLYEKLAQRIGFEVWEKRADGTTVVRIATSWATREEDVAELLEELKNK